MNADQHRSTRAVAAILALAGLAVRAPGARKVWSGNYWPPLAIDSDTVVAGGCRQQWPGYVRRITGGAGTRETARDSIPIGERH